MFSIIFFIISSIFTILTFTPIYTATEIIIPYGIHPFDICTKNPKLWDTIKQIYLFTFIFSNFIISRFIYIRILSKIISIFQNLKAKIKQLQKQRTDNSTLESVTYSKNLKDSLCLRVGLDPTSHSEVLIPNSRFVSKFFSYRYNWIRKNFQCHVPFYSSIT